MNSQLVAVVRDGFLIQVAGWALAASLQTEKFYDFTGSSTFIYLTIKSLQHKTNKTTRNWVNSSMVLIWALRLGSFLVTRIMKDGKDRRFDKVKTKPMRFLVYWLIQGVWCVLTAMPLYIINTKEDSDPKYDEITTQDYLGWGLWASGFLLEVVADRQKSLFRSKEANKGKFITDGVWAWSQHPNYFGEMCCWVGLFITCSAQFKGLEYLSVLCPMFNVYLLRFVSGVPLLRAHAEKVWGKDPVWKQYVSQTNLLFPNPFTKPVNVKNA